MVFTDLPNTIRFMFNDLIKINKPTFENLYVVSYDKQLNFKYILTGILTVCLITKIFNN